MTRLHKRLLHWKFVFYELILPLLRLLGPKRCDAALCALGRFSVCLWPGRKKQLIRALQSTSLALDLDPSTEHLWLDLAAGTARFLARDCTLEGETERGALDRFDVHGCHELERAMRNGKGAILVGSHMGAYIAGLHWLFRMGLPVRALVQRPTHISPTLSRLFDQAQEGLSSELLCSCTATFPESTRSMLIRARQALRSGHALYLCGDIPWPGPNSRPGRLLGLEQPFLAIWAELAVLTGAPVLPRLLHAPPRRSIPPRNRQRRIDPARRAIGSRRRFSQAA